MDNPAQFWAIDLHVHTPASRDVTEAQYGHAEAADVVKAALDAGLAAIAITDHNTTEWCDAVAAAAAGTDLVVLPGIEISTTDGHLLAIWEEGTESRILNECLVKLGISGDDLGKLDISTEVGLARAAKTVHDSGGLAIAAHIDQPKGLLELKVAHYVKQTLLDDHLSGVEIVDLAKVDEVKRKVEGLRELSFVRGSDVISPGKPGHRLSAIGSRRTWVKASRPDLCGIRHALEDSELRVRLDDPSTDPPHPHIVSLSVSGGFLDGMRLQLSPDLNCLVGGTGTGKSLALECIRYALNQQVNAVTFPQIANEVRSRLSDALGQNSTISVEIEDVTGDRYVIERSYDDKTTTPCVVRHRLDDGDLVATGHQPIDILQLSAFSQGEVLEYSREKVGRMSLIDSALDLSQIDSETDEQLEILRANGNHLLKQRKLVAELKAKLGGEAELKERLLELEGLFDSDTVKNQKAWQRDDAALRKILGRLPQPGTLELEVVTSDGVVAQHADNKATMDEAKKLVADTKVKIDKKVLALDADLSKAGVEAARILVGWTASYNRFKADLTKTIEKIPGKQSLVALRTQLEKVQAELITIEQTKQTLSNEAEPRLAQLSKQRADALTRLMNIRQSRRELRRGRVKELNAKTTGIVKLDIPKDGDRSEFQAKLNLLKVGSHVREATLDAIARKVHPAQFAEAMLEETYSSLVNPTAGIDLEALGRLFVNIGERDMWSALLELQELDTPDLLSVKFKREDGNFVPIESLAHGQKCTAIIVVLIADGNAPVIVDQPEDALHAPWIEDYLVDRLRSLRGQRQYVFATRSPGLVVSADAEQIITLQASAGRGAIEAAGSLERHDLNKLVLHHVEGGPVAFKRRRKKLAPSVDPA